MAIILDRITSDHQVFDKIKTNISLDKSQETREKTSSELTNNQKHREISTVLINDILNYLNNEKSDNEQKRSLMNSQANDTHFIPRRKKRDDTILSQERLITKLDNRVSYNVANNNNDAEIEFHPLVLPSLAKPEIKPVEPERDDVTIEPFNFRCVTERENLSPIDILYIIADTIENPVSRLSKEIYIAATYSHLNKCPSEESLAKLNQYSLIIDNYINNAISSNPLLKPVTNLKFIIAPMIKKTIELYRNKNNVDYELIVPILTNSINLAKAFSSISKNIKIDQKEYIINLLNNIDIKDSGINLELEEKQWEITMEEDELYATNNQSTRRLSYNVRDENWEISNEETRNINNDKNITSHKNDDLLLTMCGNRSIRGSGIGKMCSSVLEDESITDQQSLSSGIASITVDNAETNMTQEQLSIIDNLDTGLQETFPNVKKMNFYDGWTIYRVRTGNRLKRDFYHTVEVNGKLVPFRVKMVGNDKLSCEIYSHQNNDIHYNVEFYNGKWNFESPSSRSLSPKTKDVLIDHKSNICDREISNKLLSIPDHRGLKFDAEGQAFVKIENEYAKVNIDNENMYINAKNGDSYHLDYDTQKMEVTLKKIEMEKNKLSVNIDEYLNDKKMLSAEGLNGKSNHKINDNWEVLETNVNSFSALDKTEASSRIEVKFKLKYQQDGNNNFVEIPPLNWKENIKCNDNESVWQFNTDMYVHNKNSLTFYSWNQRYTSVYDYIKSTNKAESNWMNKMYDKNMNEITPETLPDVIENIDKEKAVKDYLKREGGILEIKIIDRPTINISNAREKKERVINFDIGFNNNSLIKFNQGVAIKDAKPELAFVTTGGEINLALEAVNTLPPEIVSTPRTTR